MTCEDAIDAVVLVFSEAFGGVLLGRLINRAVRMSYGCKCPVSLKTSEVHIQVGACLKRRPEAPPKTTDPSSKPQGQGKLAHLVCREKLRMRERSDASGIRGCQHINLELTARRFSFSGAPRRWDEPCGAEHRV